MTSRRTILGLLLCLVLLACGVGLIFLANSHKPTLTLARFEEVKAGMARREIIALVGLPSRDVNIDGWPLESTWLCEEANLLVEFDDADIATEIYIIPLPKNQPTFIERIRYWLGL
jgi:hypothetical protein